MTFLVSHSLFIEFASHSYHDCNIEARDSLPLIQFSLNFTLTELQTVCKESYNGVSAQLCMYIACQMLVHSYIILSTQVCMLKVSRSYNIEISVE